MCIVLKVLNRGSGIAVRIVLSIGRIVSALVHGPTSENLGGGPDPQ
jgi:hypothetical protein